MSNAKGSRSRRGPAELALTAALVQLVGQRTPCGEPGAAEAFLAEDHETRAAATRKCIGCPVFAECDAAAIENDERFGVWAGIDRGLQQHRRAS